MHVMATSLCLTSKKGTAEVVTTVSETHLHTHSLLADEAKKYPSPISLDKGTCVCVSMCDD